MMRPIPISVDDQARRLPALTYEQAQDYVPERELPLATGTLFWMILTGLTVLATVL